MLHGAKITDSKPLKSSRLFEQASGEFATFHLSAAVLDTVKGDAKVKLAVKLEEKYKGATVTLAVLSSKNDMASLDLYVNCTQEVQLMLVDAPKGTEVSISGYFEPKGDDMDDDMFNYGQEADDDVEDEDSESDEDEKLVVKGKAIEKKQDKASIADSIAKAAANSKKNAVSTAVADDEDDSDDDEDLEDMDEIDMDEDDDDEDDDDEEPVVAAPAKKDIKQKEKAKVVEDSDDDDEDDMDEDDKLVDMSDDSDDEEIDLEQVMKNASKKAKTSAAPAAPQKKHSQPQQ